MTPLCLVVLAPEALNNVQYFTLDDTEIPGLLYHCVCSQDEKVAEDKQGQSSAGHRIAPPARSLFQPELGGSFFHPTLAGRDF